MFTKSPNTNSWPFTPLKYQFPLKGRNQTATLELIRGPVFIEPEQSLEVLIDSFVGEYSNSDLGLSPSNIHKDLTSWNEGDHSVRKYYAEYFRTEFHDFVEGKIDYWVSVTVDRKVVGWATFMIEGEDKKEAYMNLLAVAPAFQGCNIGTELVFSLINLNVIPDLRACHLLLRRVNEGGREFYKRLGFVANPSYKRDENYVDLSELESLTCHNPLQENERFKLSISAKEDSQNSQVATDATRRMWFI